MEMTLTDLPPTEPQPPRLTTTPTPPPTTRKEFLPEIKHPKEWTLGDLIRAMIGLGAVMVAVWILAAVLL